VSAGVRIDATGALAGIRAARTALHAGVPSATFRAGALTQTTVRANASTGTHAPGRGHLDGTGPGPNAATGDYRRSITVTNAAVLGEAISDVDTAAVQAARLEFGFIGRDSLGRNFRQPAYPHWAPAEPVVTKYADQEMNRVDDAVHAALGGGIGG
jgi:hypothetical protein